MVRNRDILFFFFVLFVVGLDFAKADVTCSRPRWRKLQPHYDGSVEPENPRSLAGQVVVITGDRTGQGEATAELLHNSGMLVIGLSSHAKVQPGERDKPKDFPWLHYKVDITNVNKLRNVFGKIKKELNKRGYNRIENFVLNAGRMSYPPPQDTDFETVLQLISNNYGGNFNVWRVAQEVGLVDINQDTRVGWTSSTGSIGDLNFVTHYGLSKSLINWWIQAEHDLNEKRGAKVHHFMIAPWAIAGSNISCHKLYLSKVPQNEQVCKNEVNNFLINSQNPCPKPPAGPGALDSYVSDIALYWRALLREPSDNLWNVYNYITSAYPLDQNGNTWDEWIPAWEQCNPKEYAQLRAEKNFLHLLPCNGITN